MRENDIIIITIELTSRQKQMERQDKIDATKKVSAAGWVIMAYVLGVAYWEVT